MTLGPSIVTRLLSLDPSSGQLFWKARSDDLFSSGAQTAKHNAAIWNGRYSGQEAFTALDANGYLTGRIFGKTYHAHRIVWVLAFGDWPKNQIDHINGNRADNRLENLRDVSRLDNCRNAALRSDNTSGKSGVRQTRSGKWSARITVLGEQTHLGTFNEFEAACAAKDEAEKAAGFHPNHGRPSA